MHVWTMASGHIAADRLGQPFQPVADQEEHIPHAAVLQVGEHAHPEPGALAAGAGPQAQHVLAAVCGDAYGGVDGPVGHLPVPDLDHDGVDEDRHIHRIQRAGGPFRISVTTLSVIRDTVSFEIDAP